MLLHFIYYKLLWGEAWYCDGADLLLAFLIVLSLGLGRAGAAGQYLALLSAAHPSNTHMWPRRSVSRSQQWKQSLSSTQSGQSRSLKGLKASWIKSTLLPLRRGGFTLFSSVFWVSLWHSWFCISTNLFWQATVKFRAQFNISIMHFVSVIKSWSVFSCVYA